MDVLHIFCFIISLLIFLRETRQSNVRMKEMYRWKQLEYVFDNETLKQELLENGQFIPANCVPTSIARWADKIFISVPRYKLGVPATLGFININITELKTNPSPPLTPYPNLDSHDMLSRNITSIVYVQTDACDRLWALDSGQVEGKRESDATLFVYDLRTNVELDALKLRSRVDYITETFFADLVVDVTSSNCESAYIYIPDANNNEIIVYNYKARDYHKLEHNYFHFDPLCGDLTVDRVKYRTRFGVFGMATSPVGRDDHRSLYFSPLASTAQFAVSTRVLQNKSSDATEKSFYEFKLMGFKGLNTQSSAATFDEETGVLFYTLIAKNSIACWNSFSGDEFNERTQGIVTEDDNLLYPSDLQVDKTGNLWAISNRLPKFLQEQLDPEEINFRIFSGAIRSIIKGTVCDTM